MSVSKVKNRIQEILIYDHEVSLKTFFGQIIDVFNGFLENEELFEVLNQKEK